MNFLNVFEERIGTIFGTSFQDLAAPFSFKKLAKKASREMENETFVIDGVSTAPALYTILVASEDDTMMKAAYPKITREIARFLEARASSRQYTFIGQPVVRFMADPSLKSGKFSVFAENVDASTLDRLREEEIQYLRQSASEHTGKPSDAAPDEMMSARRRGAEAADMIDPTRAPKAAEHNEQTIEAPDELDVLSPDFVGDRSSIADRIGDFSDVADPAIGAGSAIGAAAAMSNATRQDPPTMARFSGAEASASRAVPLTRRTSDHTSHSATCLLINRSTGQTYTAHAPQTVIGRKRTPGGIVLHDSNISRCHAELSYDGHAWRIRDLNSTNGTLVNDIDITDFRLKDGDLITLGLINLEFREN